MDPTAFPTPYMPTSFSHPSPFGMPRPPLGPNPQQSMAAALAGGGQPPLVPQGVPPPPPAGGQPLPFGQFPGQAQPPPFAGGQFPGRASPPPFTGQFPGQAQPPPFTGNMPGGGEFPGQSAMTPPWLGPANAGGPGPVAEQFGGPAPTGQGQQPGGFTSPQTPT